MRRSPRMPSTGHPGRDVDGNREALPTYHRYLRAKARLLGVDRLAGYDLMAPVAEPATWPFETSRDFIVESSPPSAQNWRARPTGIRARWIDAGPRVGKDGGAMCTAIQGDESRILANYLPVFSWTSTLAHELGHAYHNFVIVERKRTFLQASPDFGPTTLPMSLAETASTICETIVHRGARAAATSPAEELTLARGGAAKPDAEHIRDHRRCSRSSKPYSRHGPSATLSPSSWKPDGGRLARRCR